MRQRISFLSIILVSLAILVTTSQAVAFSMPAISGGYSLKATGPSDNPSTDIVEVYPGQTITVDATATLTYSGTTITSPPISVTTELSLLDGRVEKASQAQTVRIDPMVLEDGKSYTRSGSGSIVIPEGLKPGTYTLKCSADASASVYGVGYTKSEKKNFQVKVVESQKPPSVKDHATGSSPETPILVLLKQLGYL